jgi:hypothetical protein
MGTIIALVLLALAVLITVTVLAVKAVIRGISGDIPVPRSSERTMEERVRAELQEETDARRAELQRERARLEEEHRQLRIRAQNATGVNQDILGGAVESLGRTFDEAFARVGFPHTRSPGNQEVQVTHRVETTVLGPTGGSPGQSGKPTPKQVKEQPPVVKRKSRYERDPVI